MFCYSPAVMFSDETHILHCTGEFGVLCKITVKTVSLLFMSNPIICVCFPQPKIGHFIV